jgi:hypothetical protein
MPKSGPDQTLASKVSIVASLPFVFDDKLAWPFHLPRSVVAQMLEAKHLPKISHIPVQGAAGQFELNLMSNSMLSNSITSSSLPKRIYKHGLSQEFTMWENQPITNLYTLSE